MLTLAAAQSSVKPGKLYMEHRVAEISPQDSSCLYKIAEACSECFLGTLWESDVSAR
jgi:hypothetical protein